MGQYTVEDQVFLLQFFSLFYDRVYVPVSFLTDSDRSLNVLKALNIEREDSVLHSEEGTVSNPLGHGSLQPKERHPTR